MQKVTCPRCEGDGLYHAPTSLGPYCFRCKGTGQVNYHKPRTAKPHQLSATREIASICGGIPSLNYPDVTFEYLGITREEMAHYIELWNAGVREVARDTVHWATR